MVKKLPANAEGEDAGSNSGLGRSPGGEHGNPLQYCIRAWGIPWTEEPGRAPGVAKSQT